MARVAQTPIAMILARVTHPPPVAMVIFFERGGVCAMARVAQTPIAMILARVTHPPPVAMVIFFQGCVSAMARVAQTPIPMILARVPPPPPVAMVFFFERGGVGAMARGATLPDGIIFNARVALHCSIFLTNDRVNNGNICAE